MPCDNSCLLLFFDLNNDTFMIISLNGFGTVSHHLFFSTLSYRHAYTKREETKTRIYRKHNVTTFEFLIYIFYNYSISQPVIYILKSEHLCDITQQINEEKMFSLGRLISCDVYMKIESNDCFICGGRRNGCENISEQKFAELYS